MSFSLYRCKTEEIILHGEISGLVTDTLSNQPLQKVAVKLNPLDDTTSTGNDGKYLFKSLVPGEYEIEVSKPPYATATRNAIVTSASTKDVNFALHLIQLNEFSETHLDFGFDSTQKSFTITNTGIGKLNYSITTSQDWITVNPNIGAITTAPQTINVTIDRTGLSEKKHVEWIEVVFHVGQDLLQDSVYVLLNGIMDQDKNYYGIVTIGTQTWLTENLNTGKQINISQEQKDNGIIEKWCYDCKIYGGLYTWDEAMQYYPPDDWNIIRPIAQGICPTGWHIPKDIDWSNLWDYFGHDMQEAANKLRETGTVHWHSPNDGATNETGFTALPAGKTMRGSETCNTNPAANNFVDQLNDTDFWGTSIYVGGGCDDGHGGIDYIMNGFHITETYAGGGAWPHYWGLSVRCIKDPPKNK